MAVRNLYRQVKPFRMLGWGLFAAILVGWPGEGFTNAQFIGGLGLSLLGAFALDALRFSMCGGVAGKSGSMDLPTDVLVQRLQRIELFVVPGVLLVLQLPLPMLFAVLGTLTNANVALGGGRALPGILVAFVCSMVVAGLVLAFASTGVDEPGLLASWQQLPGVVGAADWLPGAMLLLTFTVALGDVAFRLTQKLDDHRRLWQDRLTALQPFVPHGLARRMPIAQSRCWVTVVILDLVEFTARSSPLPPELVSMVLDDLLDAVVVQAARRSGTLDKFMGDGALLFFLPESNRSVGARNAWHFSQDLLAELPVLNSRWASFGLTEKLQLRIGLASGYCSLGECGTSEVRAYTIIGACVGLAERLQASSAADSMTLCSVTTRLLVESEELLEGAVSESSGLLPDRLSLECPRGDIVEFSASYEELKGFPRMRVFRPSAKVRTPFV